MIDAEETILSIDNKDKWCIDGGKCHHNCSGDCFREKFCTPLTSSGFDENWQKINE